MQEITPPLETVPIQSLPPLSEREQIDAAVTTVLSLMQLGDDVELTPEHEEIARDIFVEGRAPTKYELTQPGVVLKLGALLNEYDYDLLKEADSIRNFVVNRLIEESQVPKNAMKALELLGRVTEVGLFTDRIEVKKTDMSNEELDAKIKEKLQALSKAMESHNTYSGETVDGELVLVDAKTD